MIAILKITAGALAVCAAYALVVVCAGWLAFATSGLISMILLWCLAILLFFVVYAGYATGTIAVAIEDRHPVIYAGIAATLLCVGISAAILTSSLSFDWQELTGMSYAVIAIAVWQAERLSHRKGVPV
jgi:hypothetical protein